MKKNIVTFGLLVLFSFAFMPSLAYAEKPIAEISAIDNDIDIYVNGSSVTVSNAQGMTLQVVSLTGKVISSIRIDSPSQRIDLNLSKGCYILKVGNVVRKVAIK